MFEATRAAGLQRLQGFAPNAGAAYHHGRNYDLSSTPKSVVSQLSPWLRHRLIGEWEVLEAITAHHAPDAAMRYIQQVFWRGYFKGWLEQHPSVWTSYKGDLEQALIAPPAGYQVAINGQTGIDCFDVWALQLRQAGYLHNHARMWFASIWIFTLRLPWALGAAFFMDHLRDADPASNTLSWRWVAGLHTKGKHYLARADNIAKFTDGAFFPKGQLNETAEPLVEGQEHPHVPLPFFMPPTIASGALRIVTEEDCLTHAPAAPSNGPALALLSPDASPFARAAVADCAHALGADIHDGHQWSAAILTAAERYKTHDIFMPYVAEGLVKDGLQKTRAVLAQNNVTLHQIARPYDSIVWPHANKGFFKLKKKIPQLMQELTTLAL